MCTEYSTTFFHENGTESGDIDSHVVPPPTINLNESHPDFKETKEKYLDQDENSFKKLETDGTQEEPSDANQMKINTGKNEDKRHGDFVEPMNCEENISDSLKKANEEVSSLKEKNVILMETVQVEDEVCKLSENECTDEKIDQPSEHCILKTTDSEALNSPGNCGGGDSPTNIVKSQSESPISTHLNLGHQEFTTDDPTRDFESQVKIHDRKTDVYSKEEHIFEHVKDPLEVLSNDKNRPQESPLVKYKDDVNSKDELYFENREHLKDSSEVLSNEKNKPLESPLVEVQSSIENGIVDCNERCDSVEEKLSFFSRGSKPDDKGAATEESTNEVEQESDIEHNTSRIILDESTTGSGEISYGLERSSSNIQIKSSLRLETDTGNAGDKTLNQHDSEHELEESIVCIKQREVDECAIPSSQISQDVLDDHTSKHNFDEEAEVQLIPLKEKIPEVQATPDSILSVANNKENTPEVQEMLDSRLGVANCEDDPVKVCECDHEVMEHSLLEHITKENILESTGLQISEDILSVANRNTDVGDNSNNVINGEKDSRNTFYNIADDVNTDFSIMDDETSEVAANSYGQELNPQVTEADYKNKLCIEDQLQIDKILLDKKHSVSVTEKEITSIGEGILPISLESTDKNPSNSDTFLVTESTHLVQSTLNANNNTTEDDHLMHGQQSNESDDDWECPSPIRKNPPTISEVNRYLEDHVPTQDDVSESNSYLHACMSTNMEKRIAQHPLQESQSELNIDQESNVYTPTSKSSIGSEDTEAESSALQETPDPESGPNNNTINQYVSNKKFPDNQTSNTIYLLESNKEKLIPKNALEPILDEVISKINEIPQNNIKASEIHHDHEEDEVRQSSIHNEENCVMKVDKFSECSLLCSRDSSVRSVRVSDKSCSVLASDSDVEGKTSFHSSDHSTRQSDEGTQNLKSLYSKSLSEIESNYTADAEEKTDLESEESHVPNARNKLLKSNGNSSTLLDENDENTLNQELISLDKYSEHDSNQILLINDHDSNVCEDESSEDISLNTIIGDITIRSESQTKNKVVFPSKIEITETTEKQEVHSNNGVELESIENNEHSLTNTSSCLLENEEISIPIESEAIKTNNNIIVEESPENPTENVENVSNVEPSKTIDSQKETNDEEIPDTQSNLDQGVALAHEQTIECFKEELERKEELKRKEELERKEDSILDSENENELDNTERSNILLERDTPDTKKASHRVTNSWALKEKKTEIKKEEKVTNHTIQKKTENNHENEIIQSKTNPTLTNGATQTDELAHVFKQIRTKRSQPPIIIVRLEDAKSLNGRLETAEEKEINSLEYFPERQLLKTKENVAKNARLNTRSPTERNKPSSFQSGKGFSTILEVPDLKTNLPLTSAKLGGNFRTPNGMQNRSGQLTRHPTQTPSPRVIPSVIPTIISPVSIIKRRLKGNTVSPRLTPRGDQFKGTFHNAQSPSPTNEYIPTISCPMSIASPSNSVTTNAVRAQTDTHLDTSHVGMARRRLRFGSETQPRNTSPCGSVPLRSPRSTLQPSPEASSRNPNKFPKDWYPGYRFYISKP